MPEHLNQDQLKGYRDRTLALGELAAVDNHLGGCEPCRTALAGLADPASTASVLSGIDQARFRHLSYEQMDDWVEDRLEPAARELVMAHIGACAACARQLIAYQEYAPAMAAPIRTVKAAEAVKAPFWAFLRQPQYALGAAALIAFFIITPLTRHSGPEETGAILAPTGTAVESTIPEKNSLLVEEAASATELDTLPDSLRAGAKDALEGGRPAALKGLESTSVGMLEYPYSEVVNETSPMLRWKAFGDTYDVSLYDARHSLISRRGNLKEIRWTPPSALVRGGVYTWEVESSGKKYRGMFRVLSDAQRQELEAVHGSHLVMGAVNEQFGLLTQARAEFEAIKDRAQAEKLIRQLDELRKN